MSNCRLEHEGSDRKDEAGVNVNRTKGIRNWRRDKKLECDQNKK